MALDYALASDDEIEACYLEAAATYLEECCRLPYANDDMMFHCLMAFPAVMASRGIEPPRQHGHAARWLAPLTGR